MNVIYKYIIGTLLALTLATSASTIFLYKKSQFLDKEVGRLGNVNLALNTSDSLKNGYIRVLELDVNTLNMYNNELIHSVDSIANENKINKKNLQYATAMATSLKDSLSAVPKFKNISDHFLQMIDSVQNINLCDFDDLILNYNDRTKTVNSIKNGQFYQTLDVSDQIFLYVESDKIYRNKRKNFFDRLFHFDFKKDLIFKAKAENINKKINLDDVVVIKNSSK